MPATTGPNLGLQHGWNLAENGWHTGMDENLYRLDTLVHLSVISRTLTAPPASPTSGQRYIVGAGATGAWATKDGQVAIYTGSGWAFYQPKAGWLAYIEAEGVISAYKTTGWSPGIAI